MSPDCYITVQAIGRLGPTCQTFMDNRLAWAQAACARVMRPVIRLALAMGLKHSHVDELLRDLLLDEAQRLWRAQGVKEPNISQLSITTGLNRKAVTAKV